MLTFYFYFTASLLLAQTVGRMANISTGVCGLGVNNFHGTDTMGVAKAVVITIVDFFTVFCPGDLS